MTLQPLRRACFGILATVLVAQSAPAGAQVVTRAYVFSEEDDDVNRACGLRNASAVAAVESALRGNRVQIVSKDAALLAPKFYVRMTTVRFGQSSACATAIDLRVQDYELMPFPGTSRKLSTSVVYCFESAILSGPTYDLQTRALNSFREFTESCISEIEKRAR